MAIMMKNTTLVTTRMMSEALSSAMIARPLLGPRRSDFP